MTNLAPLYQPLGEGFALRPDMALADPSLALVADPSDSDPALKQCRSLKRPKGMAEGVYYEGCKGFRVTDSDYCQGHKTMIDKETAERTKREAAREAAAE